MGSGSGCKLCMNVLSLCNLSIRFQRPNNSQRDAITMLQKIGYLDFLSYASIGSAACAESASFALAFALAFNWLGDRLCSGVW